MYLSLQTRLVLIIGCLGIFSLSPLVLFFIIPQSVEGHSFSESITESNLVKEIPKEMSVGLPVRIEIPKIGVDARFEYVDFVAKGIIGVPHNPAHVAWFELGPRPGENGNAVINGHFGWKDGAPAVFDNLDMLVKGDRVYIVDDSGDKMVFVVRESRIYDEHAEALGVFSSNDGKSHLNLIACEGAWNKEQQSYSDRRVVFTDREL